MMRLTPQQIADLKADRNVRGQIGGANLYQVAVRLDTFERAQVLTNLGELNGAHEDVLWYWFGGDAARVLLMTNKPEWFVELEGKMEDARRPR
jgi:hypothetical protein